MAISLKKIEQEAPQLIDLAKKADISLQKANLTNHQAKVALCLDNMSDRYIDNADFFSVEDPEVIADQELYDLLMTEYPGWVKLAKTKKLLR
jgi:hypothetical protein